MALPQSTCSAEAAVQKAIVDLASTLPPGTLCEMMKSAGGTGEGCKATVRVLRGILEQRQAESMRKLQVMLRQDEEGVHRLLLWDSQAPTAPPPSHSQGPRPGAAGPWAPARFSAADAAAAEAAAASAASAAFANPNGGGFSNSNGAGHGQPLSLAPALQMGLAPGSPPMSHGAFGGRGFGGQPADHMGEAAAIGGPKRSRKQPKTKNTDSLRTLLGSLDGIDPSRIFAVRKVQCLGFDAAKAVRAHYESFGPVEQVLFAHSHVLSPCQQYVRRVRPSSLAFVVMVNAADVETALAVGPEQCVAGAQVMVERFERHSPNSPGQPSDGPADAVSAGADYADAGEEDDS